MTQPEEFRCPSCGHWSPCDCPEDCWVLYMNSMLGEHVAVTVDLLGKVVVTGKLLAWSEMGETVIEDATGDLVHCWPALVITPVPDFQAMQAVLPPPGPGQQEPEAPGASTTGE